MKTKFTFVLSMTALLLVSCTTKKTSGNDTKTDDTAVANVMVNDTQVKYTMATNYFHKSDVPLPDNLKITSAEEFERHFGMAAHMGNDGQPTNIDFDKNFVVAKVLSETDLQTELRPISLKMDGDHLLLTYSLVQGEKLSYSIQPMFILVVPNDYRNLPIKEVEENNKSQLK